MSKEDKSIEYQANLNSKVSLADQWNYMTKLIMTETFKGLSQEPEDLGDEGPIIHHGGERISAKEFAIRMSKYFIETTTDALSYSHFAASMIDIMHIINFDYHEFNSAFQGKIDDKIRIHIRDYDRDQDVSKDAGDDVGIAVCGFETYRFETDENPPTCPGCKKLTALDRIKGDNE